MSEAKVVAAHSALCPDVRDTGWVSNCAGEIFLAEEGENGARIGHFQGDAALAAFVVKAHNTILSDLTTNPVQLIQLNGV